MDQVYFLHGGQKRKGVTRSCNCCGKSFVARAGTGRWANARFCSKVCGYAARKMTRVELVCATCATRFFRPKGKLAMSRHGIYFCSRTCKDKGQRLGGIKVIQPDHYGTGKTEHRYRERFLSSGGVLKCSRCGYDEFPCSVEVHHKDEDRQNAALENLVPLCANCHRGLHNNLWQD